MTPDNRIAICPGSYDPVTYGHLDVIARASRMFELVIVSVVNLPIRKGTTLFDAEEAVRFLRSELAIWTTSKWRRSTRSSSTSPQARRPCDRQGPALDSRLRLRVRDEPLNRRQDPESVVYLMASPEYSFLSSSGVKELGHLRRRHLRPRPEPVARRLKEELAR